MKAILITSGGRVLEIDETEFVGRRAVPKTKTKAQFWGAVLRSMREYDRPEQAVYAGSVARIFVSEGGTLGEYSLADIEELAGAKAVQS